MSNICHITGKKPAFGNYVARSGASVKSGGFGLKTSGIARRRFNPNIKVVTALIDGVPQRVRVSTKAIKSGLVVKPLKRKYGYTAQKKSAH